MLFFFFNDTATTEIYTLSLHDALPISDGRRGTGVGVDRKHQAAPPAWDARSSPSKRQAYSSTAQDRKSTRLNSSHANISYAVFCLKKKHSHRRSQLNPHPITS